MIGRRRLYLPGGLRGSGKRRAGRWSLWRKRRVGMGRLKLGRELAGIGRWGFWRGRGRLGCSRSNGLRGRRRGAMQGVAAFGAAVGGEVEQRVAAIGAVGFEEGDAELEEAVAA